MILVEFLWQEVHSAKEDFKNILNVTPITDRYLPFDASLLTHITEKMLPLAKRVNALILMLDNLCQKYKADEKEKTASDDGKGVIPA